MGGSWGYPALTRSPLCFAGGDHKALWWFAQCSFLDQSEIFWVEDYLGKSGGVLAFLVQKKIQIISHNFRLWRFCFSSVHVMGVPCEERNGVYLRCTAVNDRTKVRCALRRLGIDFLKVFFWKLQLSGSMRSQSTQLGMFWWKITEKDASVSLFSCAEMTVLSASWYFSETALCSSLAQWFCMDFTPCLR